MKNYNISASVVVYNKPEDALKTIESITENTQSLNLSLYIIDNASKDNIGEKIKQNFPQYKYKILKENIGFGKGHNLVLENLDSKYHFVINPDILINQDTIKNMCEFMDANPDATIACPKVVNPDGSVQYIAKNRPSFLGLIARRIPLSFLRKIEDDYLMKNKNQDEVLDVDFCTGCFFVIKTDVFKQINGFDQDYFLYFEDADITMKAKQYGKAYYVPYAQVVHFWHRETASSIKQFLVQLKSMFIYFKKWGFKLK